MRDKIMEDCGQCQMPRELRMCMTTFTILLLLCKNSLMPEKHQSLNQPVTGAYKIVYIAAAMNLDEHTFYTCACLDILNMQPFQEFMGSPADLNLQAGHVSASQCCDSCDSNKQCLL